MDLVPAPLVWSRPTVMISPGANDIGVLNHEMADVNCCANGEVDIVSAGLGKAPVTPAPVVRKMFIRPCWPLSSSRKFNAYPIISPS